MTDNRSRAPVCSALAWLLVLVLGCSSTQKTTVDGSTADGPPAGDGTASDAATGSEAAADDAATPNTAPIAAVSLGELHSCALTADGAVWCWGNNLYSQLGDGKDAHACPDQSGGDCSAVPIRVAALSTATRIAAGYTTSCAVLNDGSCMCWGYSADPVTLGGASSGDTPVVVQGLSDAVEVAAGRRHFCALDTAGRVLCWGENQHGQLGGSEGADPVVEVAGLGKATAVAAGSDHSCAIVDGSVWCWGSNEKGQLGSAGASGATPARVGGPADVIQVAGGAHHTCALEQGGTVWCWGGNILGALGSGDYADRDAPVAVAGLADVSMIATGYLHTCALEQGGSVRCWGAADWGQLGDGKTEHGCTVESSGFAHDCSPSPVGVTGLPSSATISAGASHSCALGDDGKLRCWGGNSSGELGDGSVDSRNTPVEVVGL